MFVIYSKLTILTGLIAQFQQNLYGSKHMTNRVEHGGLNIDRELWEFVNNEALPGTGIDQDKF